MSSAQLIHLAERKAYLPGEFDYLQHTLERIQKCKITNKMFSSQMLKLLDDNL